MKRLRSSRPQPALVVAILALVAALAGTAVAADPVATTAVSKKKTKKIAKRQAKKQINKLAPGLSVDHANTADSASSASPSGPAGGDLTGNYPDPLIADGAVNSGKVEDGALRIADLAVWQASGNIGGTTVNANTCLYFNFGNQTAAQLGDLLLIRTNAIEPNGIILDGSLRDAAPPHGLSGGVCNNTASNITLPNPFVLSISGVR